MRPKKPEKENQTMHADKKKLMMKTLILSSKPWNCRTKHSDVHEPKPNPKQAASEDSRTVPETVPVEARKPEASPSLQRIGNSVAVVKQSEDPYRDFKDSMLEMVREREIYPMEDLLGLLYCFLTLNNPCHQDAIVRAFLEIWDEMSSGGTVDSGY